MSDRYLYFFIALVVSAVSLFSYHTFVTVPLMQTIDEMRLSQYSGVPAPPPVSPQAGSASPTTTPAPTPTAAQEYISVTEIPLANAAFVIPHYLTVGGQQQAVSVNSKITRIARYAISDDRFSAIADIPVCDGICAGTERGFSLSRSQAIIALDIEFSNRSRVGAIAIDPVKQFRMSREDNFYVPRIGALNTKEYLEVSELSSTSQTLIFYVPRDSMQYNFLFGPDLNDPSGLFRLDFDAKTIEALVG